MEPQHSPLPAPTEWSNRRILTLLALGTLVVSAVWHLPQELDFISKHAGEVFLTLVLAMGFTYLLRPAVNAIDRSPHFGAGMHHGRVWATLFVFFACGLLIYLFVMIGLRPVSSDVAGLWRSLIPDDPIERTQVFKRWQSTLKEAIDPYSQMLPAQFVREVEESIPQSMAEGLRQVGAKVRGIFSHAAFIVELILIPVLVFYFLSDGPAIRAEARLLLPAEWRPRASRMAAHLDRILDGFIRGQVLMCIIAWILVTLGLLLLKVPYAFTLGLIAGLTRAVPVIGPLLGGIPLMLVCLLTTHSLETTGLLLLGFTIMHFVESKVLLPKIIGHEVDLHPVSVIVALLLGMEFFGFMGVFLAVPVAALVKVLLTEWHQTRLQPPAMPATGLTAGPIVAPPPRDTPVEPAPSTTPHGAVAARAVTRESI